MLTYTALGLGHDMFIKLRFESHSKKFGNR